MDQTGDVIKHVKIFACAVQNNISKVKEKHLVFKAKIARIKIYILIDNNSKTKLIDKFFVHLHGISTFKLKKKKN